MILITSYFFFPESTIAKCKKSFETKNSKSSSRQGKMPRQAARAPIVAAVLSLASIIAMGRGTGTSASSRTLGSFGAGNLICGVAAGGPGRHPCLLLEPPGVTGCTGGIWWPLLWPLWYSGKSHWNRVFSCLCSTELPWNIASWITLGVDNSCTGYVTADPPPPAPPCPAPAPTLLTHVIICVCSNRTLSPAEGRWQAECFC
jgi:hypothetical protein